MSNDSDNLTKVHLELPNHWWFKGESIWAKHLGDELYEIQNVPFCAYGLNCGDVVRATADAPDFKPEVRAVVRRSGNQTLRVSFPDLSKEKQQGYVDAIEAKGAWVERANSNFICINVPPSLSVQEVRTYLDEQEAAGVLSYETCEAQVPGSFDAATPVGNGE